MRAESNFQFRCYRTPSLKPLPVPTADQAAEIARLRRECDRLRMERDILKNSISIFAGPLK